MIQYKHASVAVFEGYAGSSRSGFRAEVEAERRLGQLDDILDYFDARRGGARLSGPAAGKVGRALEAAAETLGPSPAMIADRARLRVLLASTAHTLHPGLLADCFFDPSTALCLASPAVGASAPVMPLCQPTRCPNACITVRHKPAWAGAADDARELLREKRLSLGAAGRFGRRARPVRDGPRRSRWRKSDARRLSSAALVGPPAREPVPAYPAEHAPAVSAPQTAAPSSA